MRKIALLSLLLAPALSGCFALGLGAVAGALVGTEVLENETYVATLDADALRVWYTAKATAARESFNPIVVDEDRRELTMDYDDAKVTVNIETFDLDTSILRVRARKYGVANGEIANLIMKRIVEDLDEQLRDQRRGNN